MVCCFIFQVADATFWKLVAAERKSNRVFNPLTFFHENVLFTESEFPGFVDGGYAKRQIADFHPVETGLVQAALERLLRRKFANAFDEILVAVAVPGDHLADPGNSAEGPGVISFGQEGFVHAAEFKAEEAPAGFKDTARLSQSGVDMCNIAEAEGDGVDVDAGAFHGEGFGIADDPVEIVEPAAVHGAVAPDAEHFGIEVANSDIGRVGRFFDPESDVTSAARNVKIRMFGAGADLADELVFPQAVDAGRHQVVHDIVAVGYRVENIDNQPGFFPRGDFLFAKPLAFGIFLRVCHALLYSVHQFQAIWVRRRRFCQVKIHIRPVIACFLQNSYKFFHGRALVTEVRGIRILQAKTFIKTKL